MNDTIAAISTALGVSAISIIRVSGKDAINIVNKLTKFKKLENKLIPADIDFDDISGLRIEAKQKLKNYSPRSIGQASRISGVSPADISVLLVYLESYRRSRER